MIIRISIAALAAAATLCAAASPVLVEEHFEGETFPPPGWSVDGSGDWRWYNPGGYAHGSATSTVGHTASCTITSPSFYLDGGRCVRATFIYVATESSSSTVDHSISLIGGGHTLTYGLPVTSEWSEYDWVSPAAPAYGYFRISWAATVYSPYGSETGVLRLDDVVLTLYNVAVTPTSIGRVKALYY